MWTWTAHCADTKLVPRWLVAKRDAGSRSEFVNDLLPDRLADRVQLTTDGNRVYFEAVEGAFGSEIDYAMLVKLYGSDPEAEKRYSPAKCIGTVSQRITGNPDPAHVSTSYIERQNLTIMHYNFGRVHQTLRVTPAMEAGVSDHVWSAEEIVGLLEAREARPEPEGSN